jgi:hypothetical protein
MKWIQSPRFRLGHPDDPDKDGRFIVVAVIAVRPIG